jgi:hypothetical protein
MQAPPSLGPVAKGTIDGRIDGDHVYKNSHLPPLYLEDGMFQS